MVICFVTIELFEDYFQIKELNIDYVFTDLRFFLIWIIAKCAA